MRASLPAVRSLNIVVAGDAALVDALNAAGLTATPATSHLDISVRSARADAVVIDASMGLERIAQLKSDVPVLALVAQDEAITAIAAGASGALHRDSPASAIGAALLALTEGLAVFDRSFVSSLVPPDRAPGPVSEAPLTPTETLTDRERQVLTLLAEGLSNKEIATHLEISEHTAKFHVNSILQKLSAQKRVEAVVRAARLGLIEL
jgi:two-component system, NarL family, nitrate/nitrite response regulator NarL